MHLLSWSSVSFSMEHWRAGVGALVGVVWPGAEGETSWPGASLGLIVGFCGALEGLGAPLGPSMIERLRGLGEMAVIG